jgi:hypothetical protein
MSYPYLRTNFRRTDPPTEATVQLPFSKAGRIQIPARNSITHSILTFTVRELCKLEFRFHSQQATIIHLRSQLFPVLEMMVGAGETCCSVPIFNNECRRAIYS